MGWGIRIICPADADPMLRDAPTYKANYPLGRFGDIYDLLLSLGMSPYQGGGGIEVDMSSSGGHAHFIVSLVTTRQLELADDNAIEPEEFVPRREDDVVELHVSGYGGDSVTATALAACAKHLNAIVFECQYGVMMTPDKWQELTDTGEHASE